MNNQSVILELRQQSTPDGLNIANGDWETIINDVDINEGDSISIQQSYLDTAAFPDGTIVIPNDLTIRFQHFVYNNKWTAGQLQPASTTSPPSPGIYPNIFGQWTSNNGDGSSALFVENANPFVLCDFLKSDDVGDYVFAPFFRIDAIGDRSGFNEKYGGYTITIEYQAVGQTGSQRAYRNIQIEKDPNRSGNYQQFVINITYNKDVDIKVSSPSKFKINKNGGRTSFPGSGAAVTTGQWHPRLFTTLFPLKAGQYTPQTLCKALNDEFQTAGSSGEVTEGAVTAGPWGSSKFFVSSDGMATDQGFDSGGGVLKTATLMNVANEQNGFSYVASYQTGPQQAFARNIWIGASQVELAYNEDTQLFFFNYLHTPLYQGGEESVAVKVNKKSTGDFTTANADFANIYSSGGIMLHSLTAFEGILGSASEVDVDFFGETLKFNLNKLYAPPYSMSAAMTGVPFAGDLKPYWNYLPTAQTQYFFDDAAPPAVAVGLTLTGGYIGNDNLLIKDANTTSTDATDRTKNIPPWECPPVPSTDPAAGQFFNAFNPVFSTTTANYTLKAADQMFKNTDIRSHYLIEVDAKFRGNFLTDNTNYRTIGQIVGKYFTKGSFTESGGGGFLYTHVGPPLKLSSFKCRILFPDKTLATDIGPDNAIYMAINRNPNAQQLADQQLEEFIKENTSGSK